MHDIHPAAPERGYDICPNCKSIVKVDGLGRWACPDCGASSGQGAGTPLDGDPGFSVDLYFDGNDLHIDCDDGQIRSIPVSTKEELYALAHRILDEAMRPGCRGAC